MQSSSNKFCEIQKINKIYYAINYSQKKIYIFLKNIINKTKYSILKDWIEQGKTTVLPLNILKSYYNYFENNELNSELDATKGKDFYQTYIYDKILIKDILDFQQKNKDFKYTLVDDNIYDNDTNKIVLSKIAYYCCDNSVSKNNFSSVFAWYKHIVYDEVPLGFNYAKYIINTNSDDKFKLFLDNHKGFKGWNDELIDKNFLDESNQRVYNDFNNKYNELFYTNNVDNIIFFTNIDEIIKPDGFR